MSHDNPPCQIHRVTQQYNAGKDAFRLEACQSGGHQEIPGARSSKWQLPAIPEVVIGQVAPCEYPN
jgi:hypothetical protein